MIFSTLTAPFPIPAPTGSILTLSPSGRRFVVVRRSPTVVWLVPLVLVQLVAGALALAVAAALYFAGAT